MSDLIQHLKLAVEWEDGTGVKGEELRTTWGRLFISIGKAAITFVEDRRSKSTREAVYGPAYPLAEWFAFNWWPLFNEETNPSRQAGFGVSRHNIRFAGEGQAFPDLQLYSRDEFMDASWRRYCPKESPVSFPNNGSAILSTEQVKEEVSNFIDTVIARLHESGVHDCPLMQEWDAIKSIGDEELEFCHSTGALGLDPFDLKDGQASDVISVATKLPHDLQREFFRAADPFCFKEQAEWILAYATMTLDRDADSLLNGKKGLYRNISVGNRPWEVGYKLASRFREEFPFTKSLTDKTILNNFCWILDAHPLVPNRPGPKSFEAIVRLPSEFGPWIATPKKRGDSQVFLQAKAICDYLCMQTEQFSLLTPLNSTKQSRNRAFAAELLAPAEEIRKNVSASRISGDEVDDIAYEFQVSRKVIKHQILNHRIAEVEEAEWAE